MATMEEEDRIVFDDAIEVATEFHDAVERE